MKNQKKNPPHVLVVDDDSLVQMVHRNMLTFENKFTVDVASDGSQGANSPEIEIAMNVASGSAQSLV